MKRFLAEIGIFFLPLFVAAPFADAVLSEALRKSREGDLGVWNEIYAGRASSDVVIYGTSRVALQFDPQILSDRLGMTTYNLGFLGNNFWIQYLRHSILLKYNARPKVIVQSVEPFTFLDSKRPFDADQFLPFLLVDSEVNASAPLIFRSYTFGDRHVPMVRYYGKASVVLLAMKLSLNPGASPAERSRGYMSIDTPWDGDSEKTRREWLSLNMAPDLALIQLFDRYLRECRDLGIKVIFVKPPEYIDTRSFVPYRAELSAIVKAMSLKYGIPLLDYSENELTSQPRYFADIRHLNAEGATLFTKELAAGLRPFIANNVSAH